MAVALALGLGTMVGWKRVVVTVGERIGKDHLTYAQGASAGLVAMGTIFAADKFGLPGEHHAHSQFRRGRNDGCKRQRPALLHGPQHRRGLGLTLPAAALLSGLLYWVVPPSVLTAIRRSDPWLRFGAAVIRFPCPIPVAFANSSPIHLAFTCLVYPLLYLEMPCSPSVRTEFHLKIRSSSMADRQQLSQPVHRLHACLTRR